MSKAVARNEATRCNPGIVRLVLGLFLIRALIPIGFMPAPLESGGPIMICHGGVAGASFDALSTHRASTSMSSESSTQNAATKPDIAERSVEMHHAHPAQPDETPDGTHDGWERCSLGTAAGTAALVPDYAFDLLSLDHAYVDAQAAIAFPVALLPSYQARAPPSHISRRLT
jgi:hypothetical protein